jgi:hypothetical protein
MGLHRGPWILALRPSQPKKTLQKCPCRLSMAPGVPVSGVLAGGEVLAGDGLVLRDLQALRCPPVGDVHQGQRRSTVGGEQWRRPCRGVVVPGEGPVNMGEQDACEHRGSAGMLSPNLIWTEAGRRVVIDGGVELGFSPAAMAPAAG